MSVEVKKDEGKRLVRALRVELKKPISDGHSWDVVGPLLRAQRYVMPRLLDAAIFAAVEHDNRIRRGEPVGIFKRTRKNPELRPGIPKPATAAYREIEWESASTGELVDIRAWAAETRAKVLKRKKRDHDYERFLGILEGLRFTGPARSVMGQWASSRFNEWKKAKLKGQHASLSTWKKGAPIPVRADEAAVSLDDEGRPVLALRHGPGLDVTWAVSAGKGSHYGRLRRLASKENGVEMGDVKLKYIEREKKWYAFIAYKEPRPEPPSQCDPTKIMVVHRGQRNFLTVMATNGRWKRFSGSKLRAQKRKFAARRQDVQKVGKLERGHGAHGHGRSRRYSIQDALREKEKRAVTTFIQQAAAWVVTLAKEWGVGTILIEDYGGLGPDEDRAKRRFLDRFPNYQLKEAIAWALTKEGLELGEYSSEFISTECPKCGNRDARQHVKQTGIFHCRSCNFERPVDFVAALHALRRSNKNNAGEWEKQIKRVDELASSLKQTKRKTGTASKKKTTTRTRKKVAS